MVAPRSDSYPPEMPRPAPRRSTSVQVTFAKSARVRVLPGKLTRSSRAPANSTSRSRQFSNVTSVRPPLRKFTESSLQSRNLTRRSAAEKACTPASEQPARVTSSQPVSARSLDTNLVSRSVVSVNLALRSRASPNDTLRNEQSRKWQFPAAASSNETPEKSRPSYSSSGSRPPSWGVSSPTWPAMDSTLPAQVGQHGQYPPVILGRREQAELAEQVPDVGFQRFGGHVELPRDRLVRPAFGHKGQHGQLAFGECLQRAIPPRPCHQPGHDLRVDHRLARRHPPDRVGELRDVGHPLLEHVADAARVVGQQLKQVLGLDVLG